MKPKFKIGDIVCYHANRSDSDVLAIIEKVFDFPKTETEYAIRYTLPSEAHHVNLGYVTPLAERKLRIIDI